MTLINDMELSTSMYDKLYESVFRINYSAAVYKQLDRLVWIKENCCWIVVLTLLLTYYEGHGEITTISQRNMYERLSQSWGSEPWRRSGDFPSNFRDVLQREKILQVWKKSQYQRQKGPANVRRKLLADFKLVQKLIIIKFPSSRFQELFLPLFELWLTIAQSKVKYKIQILTQTSHNNCPIFSWTSALKSVLRSIIVPRLSLISRAPPVQEMSRQHCTSWVSFPYWSC